MPMWPTTASSPIPNAAWFACWAPTRRHFHQALDTDSAHMGAVLAYIAHLYKVEKHARRSGIVGEDLRLLRQHASQPVLENLHEYLEKIREEVLRRAKLAKRSP